MHEVDDIICNNGYSRLIHKYMNVYGCSGASLSKAYSHPAPEQRRSSLQCSRVSTYCIEVPNIPPCFKSLIRSLLVQLLQLLLTRSANHRLRGLGKPLSLVAEWIRMIRRIISLRMPPQSIPRVFSAKLGGHAPDHEEMDFTVLPLHSTM